MFLTQAELKEGGADCPVTNANKLEYIALIIKWRFLGRVEKQVRTTLLMVIDDWDRNLFVLSTVLDG